jgi:pimeloyl-ACP methyl ester carboxylesterase
LAVRRPELFRSLAVHEPPVFDVLQGHESPELAVARDRIERVSQRLADGDLEGGAALFADTVVGSAGNWESFSPESRASMIWSAPTFLDENRDPGVFALDLERLAGFAKPALLSYGDTSPDYFASVVMRVAAVLPNSRVHSFAGAGHVPHRTHPAEFVEALTEFISNVG